MPGESQVRQRGGVGRGKGGMGGRGVVVVGFCGGGGGVGVGVGVERMLGAEMTLEAGLGWMERAWKDWERFATSLGLGEMTVFGGG